jgi:hypothetical protein
MDDSLEDRLKKAAEDWNWDADPDTGALLRDTVNFIEEVLGISTDLAVALERETAARSFYAQTLVAISKYRGGDKTLPQTMALVAVADVLPAPDGQNQKAPDAHT